jgi:hypothetical protein
MNSYTPAPWMVEDDGCSVISLACDEALVASVYCGGYSKNDEFDIKRRQANAHLIAAAPELFGACVKVCATLDAFNAGGETSVDDAVWLVDEISKLGLHDIVTAAIAKAAQS